MSIRYRQLQAFHATVEAGTVTAAAGQLGISQPGISNLLAQLERETRFKLFERVRGRLVPTPEARVLFGEVDTVVRGLDHVSQAVIDLQNKQAGQLQVACQHSISFGPMPQLIAQFAAGRPDMAISFQAQYSSKIQEWVDSGLFEIGVCELPLLYDTLDADILRIETVLAVPADSPLTEHDVLTPDLLRDTAFIVMGPDHMTHRRTREAFHDAGQPFRTRVHSHLFKNLVSFVKEGMGVAIVDPFVALDNRDGRFVTRTFRPRILLDMAVITSRARPVSAIGRDFRDLVLAEMRKYALED